MSGLFPKAFIFGAGTKGRELLPLIKEKYQVVAFLDNDNSKWGIAIDGVPCMQPEAIIDNDYDIVIIALTMAFDTIIEQLIKMGVDEWRINSSYVSIPIMSRVLFIEKLSELFKKKGIKGCVAEGGVYQGEFAKEINRVFAEHKLYLFDTFTGFDKTDVDIEHNEGLSNFSEGYFAMTSEELVRSRLPHPDMAIFMKGHFPMTAENIDDVFCFVNLDFDLYQPILFGLEYFIPRMVEGGIVLIHDYFSHDFKGVEKAVKDYEKQHGALRTFPIGDGISIGIYC